MRNSPGDGIHMLLLAAIGAAAGSTTCPGTSFEDSSHGWTTWADGTANFIRDAYGTPSSRTGPSSAHDGTYYYYLETSGSGLGDVAYLCSPYIHNIVTMSFHYHMFGTGIGDLEVFALNAALEWPGEMVWAQYGEHSSHTTSPYSSWSGSYSPYVDSTAIDITPSLPGGAYMICFHGARTTNAYGPSYRGDLAVDSIVFECNAGDQPPSPPAPPPPPPMTPQLCSESSSCYYTSDGDCDDGGLGSEYAFCNYGEDCTDCGPRAPAHCSDSNCAYASDGDCDDGGDGAEYSFCDYGEDCTDCGQRPYQPSPPPAPPSQPACALMVDIVLIIDKSGSMSTYRDDLLAAELALLQRFEFGAAPGCTWRLPPPHRRRRRHRGAPRAHILRPTPSPRRSPPTRRAPASAP